MIALTPAASVAVTATKRGTPEPQSAPAVEKDQRQKVIKEPSCDSRSNR
jgi:hypothetical protein